MVFSLLLERQMCRSVPKFLVELFHSMLQFQVGISRGYFELDYQSVEFVDDYADLSVNTRPTGNCSCTI